MRDVLTAAMNAGKALFFAKRYCQHGSWTNWLRENFEASEETARVYIRVWRNRREIETVRDGKRMTLDEAIRFLRVPKENKRGTQVYLPTDEERHQSDVADARQIILDAVTSQIESWTDEEVIKVSRADDLRNCLRKLICRERDARAKAESEFEDWVAENRRRSLSRELLARQKAEEAYEDWLQGSFAVG